MWPEGSLHQGVLETIKFFFRFEPKRTETQSVSVVFRFVSRNKINFFPVCFGVSVRYQSNRNKPKQTEKISKKQISIRVSSKQLTFFRFEPKQTETQPVSVVFRFVFFTRSNNIFFGLFRCFGPVSKQLKQTELIVWRIKKVYILTNLLLFWLVFCLFRLFRNTETPCFDIKAKQSKQMSCFEQCRNQFRLFRYETSFGGHPSLHIEQRSGGGAYKLRCRLAHGKV